MTSQKKTPTSFSTIQPFIFGGISGMTATAIIQPIDMIKVRIQLSSTSNISSNPFIIANQMVAQGGIKSLYKGLSAGLLRQATYTTARMGLFNTFISTFKQQNEGKSVTLLQRAIAGLAAGGLGAIVGNPCDLVLIRMQADGALDVSKRANYKGVIDALSRIAREEGVLSLWKGCGPTVVRAMALNLGMLSTYSEAKHQLEKRYGTTTLTFLGSSAIAGFAASFLSLPFDFIKTRLQQNTTLKYTGSIDCIKKVIKQEGIFTFYKGFGTFFFRIAPHAMITLLVADALGLVSKKLENGENWLNSNSKALA